MHVNEDGFQPWNFVFPVRVIRFRWARKNALPRGFVVGCRFFVRARCLPMLLNAVTGCEVNFSTASKKQLDLGRISLALALCLMN